MARAIVIPMDLDDSVRRGRVSASRIIFDVVPDSDDYNDLIEYFTIMLSPEFAFRVYTAGDQFAVFLGPLPTYAFVAICDMLSLQTDWYRFDWVRPGARRRYFGV